MLRKLILISVVIISVIAGYFAGRFYNNEAELPSFVRDVFYPESRIKGIIVNHHLLADKLIDEAFSKIKTGRQVQVILLSPNHFDRGGWAMQTSDAPLKTPFGEFPVDAELARQLMSGRLVSSEPGTFGHEHGIYNLLPYLKKYLPNATFVPVIAKDRTSNERIDKLAERISQVAPEAIVISSLDFSHYLTSTAAQFHDLKSLRVIQNLDLEGVQRTEIDSKPILRLTLKLMALGGADNFTLLQNTNSALYTNTHELTETTSYITGFFTKGLSRKANDPNTNILFFGDIMLDRQISSIIKSRGFPSIFEPMARLFDGNDLVVANLEGCFTDSIPNPIDDNEELHFTFDPKLAPQLRALPIDLVSLANNHTLNFKAEGLSQCKDYLSKAGTDYFGDPQNRDQLSVVREVNGLKIAFVGYNQFFQSEKSALTVADEIGRLRSLADYIIVYPHWGTEYESDFSSDQQIIARKFIDAGADVIIGSHPHVIQPIEIYKGKPILYSVGNFIFDQIFSEEVRSGLSVGLVLRRRSIQIHLIPFEMNDWRLHLLPPNDSAILLKKVAEKSVVPEEIKKSIINGIINLP